MPEPRFAFCIFCDDIRAEVGNKFSLMGIYQDDIVFPADIPPGPVIIPKLAIAWWLLCDTDDRPERMTVRVYAPPGRTEIGTFDYPIDLAAQPQPLFGEANSI